jgi:hypothetical protein
MPFPLSSGITRVETMRVSVIIPAHNAENCLAQSLDRALEQTISPDEVVVINDGSTDGTGDVARGYGERIVYLEQANAGQGAARNRGLTVATGDLIAFLDSDDYWHPEFLERCVGFLQSHPEAVAVNTGLLTRLQDGRELLQPALLTGPDAPTEAFMVDDFYAFWAEHDHVRTGSVVIRKSVIDEAGGQRADLRVSQDLEYWGYIATFGPWGYIPEPLWVGNSRAAAAGPGWLTKYRKRRRLCPTVESWQERLLPRVTEAQMPHFLVVRGRVAAGYAQNHILGGNPEQARHILRTYWDELPRTRVTRLLRAGHRLGPLGWWIACRIVVAREYAKAVGVQWRARSLTQG